MRKLATIILGSLLIISNSFAAAAGLDAQSLTKALKSSHKVTGAEKGSFDIVYGGQDISRGSIGTSLPGQDTQVMVG